MAHVVEQRFPVGQQIDLIDRFDFDHSTLKEQQRMVIPRWFAFVSSLRAEKSRLLAIEIVDHAEFV